MSRSIGSGGPFPFRLRRNPIFFHFSLFAISMSTPLDPSSSRQYPFKSFKNTRTMVFFDVMTGLIPDLVLARVHSAVSAERLFSRLGGLQSGMTSSFDVTSGARAPFICPFCSSSTSPKLILCVFLSLATVLDDEDRDSVSRSRSPPPNASFFRPAFSWQLVSFCPP